MTKISYEEKINLYYDRKNGMMENFFGLLKTEMFYDQEDKYKTLDELIIAIDDYINNYNYDRIKVKLKGLSPVNYRLQSSN